MKYPLLTLGEIWRLIRRTLYLNIPKKYYFLPSMFCFHLVSTVFVFSNKNGINTRWKKCNYFHLKIDFLCFSKKFTFFSSFCSSYLSGSAWGPLLLIRQNTDSAYQRGADCRTCKRRWIWCFLMNWKQIQLWVILGVVHKWR